MDTDLTGPARRDESGDPSTGSGTGPRSSYELMAAVPPYERAVLLSQWADDTDPLWLVVRGNNRLTLGMIEAPSPEFADRVVALCVDRGLTAQALRLPRGDAEAFAENTGLRPAAELLSLEPA